MEKLITQLANKNSGKNTQEALGLALKEVVLSGLSRSGFLKEAFYLSSLDHFEKDTYCLCFLQQNEDGIFPLNKCLPFLKAELIAFGVDTQINEIDSGFSIEYENIRFAAYVHRKDLNLKPEYFYQQVPLAYELRIVCKMKEGARKEISKAMRAQLFSGAAESKKKKGASKAPSKSKEKQPQQEHWVQPSLFDF